MARLRLLDANGLPIEVAQDESARAKIELEDFDESSLNEAAILTLQLTLTDTSGNVINGRDDQDIKDANGTVVDTDGTVWVHLSPSDNAIQDGTLDIGDTERHVMLMHWTWNDGVSIRTGRREFDYVVRKVART